MARALCLQPAPFRAPPYPPRLAAAEKKPAGPENAAWSAGPAAASSAHGCCRLGPPGHASRTRLSGDRAAACAFLPPLQCCASAKPPTHAPLFTCGKNPQTYCLSRRRSDPTRAAGDPTLPTALLISNISRTDHFLIGPIQTTWISLSMAPTPDQANPRACASMLTIHCSDLLLLMANTETSPRNPTRRAFRAGTRIYVPSHESTRGLSTDRESVFV